MVKLEKQLCLDDLANSSVIEAISQRIPNSNLFKH